jgi:hypothetical protein
VDLILGSSSDWWQLGLRSRGESDEVGAIGYAGRLRREMQGAK